MKRRAKHKIEVWNSRCKIWTEIISKSLFKDKVGGLFLLASDGTIWSLDQLALKSKVTMQAGYWAWSGFKSCKTCPAPGSDKSVAHGGLRTSVHCARLPAAGGASTESARSCDSVLSQKCATCGCQRSRLRLRYCRDHRWRPGSAATWPPFPGLRLALSPLCFLRSETALAGFFFCFGLVGFCFVFACA